MRLHLRDKIVVVTGASRGIGAHLARCFAARQARVILVARQRTELQRLETQICDAGGRAQHVCADLRDSAARVDALARAQARWGPVDVLVNNAGCGLYGRVEDLESEELREVMELNLIAPAHLSALVLPAMRRRSAGAIVMVSSVLAGRAIPMSGGYCASKFALEGLSQSLRAELSASGIALLMVRPGRTESSFRASAMTKGYRPTDSMKAMEPEVVAAATVRALERGASEVNFTATGRTMMVAQRVVPALVDRAMASLYHKMARSPSET